ncbi:hypothetical protein [Pseudalkalibacillus caeni]|uniref:Uncharacterized protein n=1 Tax=Exobacillus caeni TaxID=2574798 RepID=A0A5R9F8G8_9BACL|nr:hypothetical protein [Pseudalkalibacillus caeni]TLS37143.1 hypothetical protein FCL54_11485 [Pseudalkalibacillus caeni]
MNLDRKTLKGLPGAFSLGMGMIGLLLINFAIWFDTDFPGLLSPVEEIAGIFLAIVGLFMKVDKKVALAGLLVNIFLIIFVFLTLMLSWGINPKP